LEHNLRPRGRKYVRVPFFFPTAGPAQIAKEITRVLRRSEEARIYDWRAKHRQWPPSRRRPDS
jgi:hypothetical protein